MRFLFVIFSLFSATLSAEESVPGLPHLLEGQGNHYWKDFANMLTTLLFVLGLILFTVWFLKKILRSRMRQLNKTTGIKVLERRALTTKASLYLVSVLGKGVVIAESSAGIQLITELSTEKDIELLLAEKLEERESSSPSFATILQKKMKELIKRDGVS